MTDVLYYLKHTKNTLIGNPSAKLKLRYEQGNDGPLLPSIISYVNYSTVEACDASSSSSTDSTSSQIRAEAANIIASLAHGPREVLFALLTEDAPSAILNALASLSEHDPIFLKVVIVRALRALCVAIADSAGPSLWGLGEECLELRSETRSMLDYIFQTQAFDVYLPLLESPSAQIRLIIAQLIAYAVRVTKHRIAITDWLPPVDRVKENKGKRGWEVSALVDAKSPSRQGGWVIRHLTAMLGNKDFATQEASLYAVAALVKDNPNIALVLSKAVTEHKSSQSVLSMASDLSGDRRTEVQLAACLCATNILRSVSASHNRRLSNTILHVLSAILANTNEPTTNRTKACHILSLLVTDDNERCVDAWTSGTLAKLADVINTLTPTTKPQEWEDGEAIDITHLREAALTAIASLALLNEEIRNEIAGVLNLLPLIAVCLEHPYAGVRYGGCHCVRVLGRSVRVLRTNLLDSGVGTTLCEIVENRKEDRRVTNTALSGLCNLVNDFSPLRKSIMERGMVSRVTELARAQEDGLRVNALWVVKNLLNKASPEEKEDVMRQIGWDYLKSCLIVSNENVQEQALNILCNIASSQEDIDIVFQNIDNDDLIQILADALESPSEEVVCQAVKVVSNISNGHHTRESILSSARILQSLRACLVHHRIEIRYASISCIDELARSHPYKMKEFGIDETLKTIVREAQNLHLAVGTELAPESRNRMSTSGTGIDGAPELRDITERALRSIDGC